MFYPGSTQSSLGEINTVESTFHDNSIVQIGSVENSSTDKGFREVSPTQVGIDENSFINFSPAQVSLTQISLSKVGFFEFSSTEIGIDEISPTQISVPEISSNDSDLTKISFAPSVEPEQFFSVHNITPKITNVLNNSATNICSDLLQPQTELDIDFQITNLPKGQLAEATITGFDDSGV